MKRIILDNCFINKLIDTNNKTNVNYNFLSEKIGKSEIEVYAIPTNILEIALCPDLKKRNALAKALNELIKGRNIFLPWEAYQVLFLFQTINEEIPGILINESALTYQSKNYSKLLLGLLGQLCFFKDYEFEAYQYLVKEKLITKYYQARFVSEPEEYLRLYKEQTKGNLKDEDIEDDSILDEITIQELEVKINEKLENRKSIKNVKDFSNCKNDLINFFSRYEFKNLLINYFKYKEQIEDSLNLKLLVVNWNDPLLGNGASPLHPSLTSIANNTSQLPSKTYYHQILLKLVDRLPSGYYFPLDHIYNIYLNELEKIINGTKNLSKGSAFDLDYYPVCLLCDHFITADRDLFENIRRMLKKCGKEENRVLSYSGNWREIV